MDGGRCSGLSSLSLPALTTSIVASFSSILMVGFRGRIISLDALNPTGVDGCLDLTGALSTAAELLMASLNGFVASSVCLRKCVRVLGCGRVGTLAVGWLGV